MAGKNDSTEIKQLLEKLYSAIRNLNQTSKSLTQNNRDLLKVMALLQSGFAQNEEDAQKLIGDVRDGLELTDEYAIKWAKQRKATKKDLDDIIDKFRELEDIDSDLIETSKDYIDLLEDRYDHIQSEFDITNNLLRSYRDINKIVTDTRKAAQKLGSSIIDVDSTVESLVKKKTSIDTFFDGIFNSVPAVEDLIGKIDQDIQSLIHNASGSTIDLDLNFNPLSGQIDNEISKVMDAVNLEKNARLKGLDDFFEKNSKLQSNLSKKLALSFSKMKGIDVDIDTGAIKKNGIDLRKGTSEYQKVIENLNKTIVKNNITDKLKSGFSEIVQLIGRSNDLTQSENDRLNDLIKPLDLSTKLLLEQYQIRMKDLDAYEHGMKMQKHTYSLLSENLHLLSSAENIVQKIGSGFDYLNAIMPLGIGEFLGLSKVSMSLMDSHRKGVQSFINSLQQGVDKSEAMKEYLKEMTPAIKMALNPMTLLVAGGLLLFNLLTDTVQKYKDMSKEMKVSILQASKLFQVQLDIVTSQKNQFATMQDIQDAQTEMIAEHGKVYDLSTKSAKELTISLVETSKAFGYSVQEAVQLHKVFKNIGADDKLAMNLQQNLDLMSEMAGLSPQIVSQDLIDGSEVVATYFAGLPDKAAKSAIQIRRMGLSLKKAGEIAQQMLNLEGFMTDMYELQAMSGRIDFSHAFEKGLMGDIEGMTKDIMDNIGSTAEYNKMDYLTRVKIAKTLNMSVDELAKSVKLHEQMQGLDQKDQNYLDANLDRMGDISNLSQDEIRNRLQQLQSTDRLGVAWDKIKATFLKALIPLAESFADAIDAISPLIDVLVGALKLVGIIIKPLVPLVKGLLAPFKIIGDIVSGIIGAIESWFDPVSNVEDPLKSTKSVLDLIGKAAYYVGATISSWFIGKKVLGSIGLIDKETTSLGGTVSMVGTMFKSLFSSSSKESEKSSENISKNSKKSLSNIAAQAEETASEVQKSAKKSSKNSNFINPISSKGSFKIIGSLAAATFAKMAVHGAESYFNIRKSGEENMLGLSDDTLSIFENLAVVAGPLLSNSLQEGFERVFTKKIEKRVEDTLTKPLDKVTDSFTNIGKKGKGIFGQVLGAGKSLFSKLTNIGSKLLPNVFDPMSTSFDRFAGKAENTKKVITDTVETVKKIVPKTEIAKEKKKPEELKPDISKNIVKSGKKKELKPDISEEINKKVKKGKEVGKKTIGDNLDKQVKKPSSKTKSTLVSGFDSFMKIIERFSKTIRKVLGDIVGFVSDSMKTLSSGIGTSIKNILKGIGDGLNSFKTSALKGAAALVVVSGALWITSKAMQNFANVSWSDVGKGIVSLGGLVGLSLLLGKSSVQMIIGAVGIAALGAALIPAAIALNKFNDVDWGSLAKAGVALVGLGVAGTVLSAMSVEMLIASVGVAALGLALIPTTIALNKFNDIEWSSIGKGITALSGFGVVGTIIGAASPLLLAGSLAIAALSGSVILLTKSIEVLNSGLQGIDSKPIEMVTGDLLDLNQVSVSQIFGLSGALATLSGALLAFNTVSGINSILKSFGGSVISDLEKLGNLADPLYIVLQVVNDLGKSFIGLFDVLDKLDFSVLDKFNNIDVKSIDSKIQEQIEINKDISSEKQVPAIDNKKKIQTDQNQKPTFDFKFNPFENQKVSAEPPKKESVAQNVKIDPLREIKVQQEIQKQKQQEQEEFDIYNRPELATKKLELLLMQANQLLEAIARKDIDVYLDGQRVTAINKKFNNNKG